MIKTNKLALNFKFLRFLLIPTILFSTPFFNNIQDAKAGLEFQWDQDSNYRRLKWFQKENKRGFRNTIYFFFRPSDRRTDLLKIKVMSKKVSVDTWKNNKFYVILRCPLNFVWGNLWSFLRAYS